jgi:hypothetical protein
MLKMSFKKLRMQRKMMVRLMLLPRGVGKAALFDGWTRSSSWAQKLDFARKRTAISKVRDGPRGRFLSFN